MSNPTSTIILYKNSKIIPSRNMILDSLADYLSSLTKITIANFQYQRHHLEMEIKIDKTQTWQEFDDTYNYDYLSIQNSDSNRVVYYFILEKRQVANSTIALKLRMDTANTFQWNVDYIPSNRTKVTREHKDRMECLLVHIQFRQNSDFTRLITLTSGDTFDGKLVLEIDGVQEEIDATFKYLYVAPLNYSFTFVFTNKEDQIRFYRLRDSDSVQVISFYDENNPTGIVEGNDLYFSNEYASKNVSQKRLIDYYSEGFTPVLYKTELGTIIQKEKTNWNLVYQNNDNDNKVIDCFCIPSTEGLQFNSSTNGTLTYTDFVDGVYYNFCPYNINGEVQNLVLVDDSGREYAVRARNIDGQNNWTIRQVRRTGTTLQIRGVNGAFYNNKLVSLNTSFYSWITVTSLTFEGEYAYYRSTTGPTPLTNVEIAPYNGYFTNSMSSLELISLQNINRASPKLIKIIEIPYFPSSYTYDENTNTIGTDSTWAYSATDKVMVLNNLNTNFSSIITSSIDNPIKVITMNYFDPSLNDNRNDEYESKLYHSDYYQPKFVYDSFGFVFRMEKVDEELFDPSGYFTFEFIMTSTINSKFMFRFPEYVLKMAEEDYDNILSVARNNEAPIYNSAYINYLTTAYRYDLKAKNIAGLTIGAGAFGGMGYGISQAIGGAVTDNWGQFAAGLGKAFVAPFAALIATGQQERNFEKNLEILKNQANSVSGSDDIDLLNAYSGNKAKLCLYQVSDRVKQLLADLFYYYGYTTNEIKVPSLNTRNWFNFVSCELELKGTGDNIPNDLIDDIKQRFNTGITIFHKVNGTWDLDQEKENWEVSII